SIRFDVVDTESDLSVFVDDLPPGVRGLVPVGLRLSTSLEPTETVRPRFTVEASGAPVPGVTFYYDRDHGPAGLHDAWPDAVQAAATGSGLRPRPFAVGEVRGWGRGFVHGSLEGPAAGNRTLEAAVERASDGEVLAVQQVGFMTV